MRIVLHQAVSEPDNSCLVFRKPRCIKTAGSGAAPVGLYERVDRDKVDANSQEDVFRIFNPNHLKDYRAAAQTVGGKNNGQEIKKYCGSL